MRCDNCLWFPMEVSTNDDGGLICPNCGYIHLESNEEAFVREIYQNSLMPDTDEGLETLEYWEQNREYLLSGKREENLQ